MGKILKNLIFNLSLIISTSVYCQIIKPLRIPLHAAKISLDPSGVQDLSSLFVARQINCQLVRASGSLVEYDAVESVKFISPIRIRMTIKKAMHFQDGSELEAEDVVATFDHLKKSRNVLRNVFNWIAKIEVINHKELDIFLKKPVPQFLRVFSSPNYAIFKKTFLLATKNNPALWQMPMGCGNYKVIENNKQIIRLSPTLQGHPIEFYLNKNDQLNLDEMDKFDIIDLHLPNIKKVPNHFIQVTVFDPTQIYLGLNTKLPRWHSKTDRCQFLKKLDATDIIKSYGDFGRAATDILPSGILGYSPSLVISSQPSAIQQSLDNFNLSILSVSIPIEYRVYYENMLKAIYPQLTTSLITDNKHFGKSFVESHSDAIILGLKSNTLDGYDILAVFSELDPNFTGFYKADLIKKIEDSQEESDPKVRAALYRDIVRVITDNCLVYPILTIPNKVIYVKKALHVPNIGKGPLNEYDLSQVS